MTSYTLTVLDTLQIQRYVFGSNRLQENVGSSHLVELATHRWIYEALPAEHNISDVAKGTIVPARTIEDGLTCEVIYAGGGNTAILFRSPDLARDFTRRLTRQVLLKAPGLELVVAHREFEWEQDSLGQIVQETLGRDLARKKLNRQASIPLLGLGVTTACQSTGLAASTFDSKGSDRRPISREVAAKLDDGVQAAARARLLEMLPRMESGGWRIPVDFDNMGRIKGEEGYLAVVHADGNGMGQRVEKISQQYVRADMNRAYIAAIRDFSNAVEAASKAALNATVDLLADALQEDSDLPADYPYFPFRPIVFGGDDVTFVCNGKYGLPLAVRYLQEFEKATAEDKAFDGKSAHACAGVAVVKIHYPFARAYRMSEALTKSAKTFARDKGFDGSAIDWHFAMSGITGSLESVRSREYTSTQMDGQTGRLHMRPVVLAESAITWRTWPVFRAITEAFALEEEWYERRNKVKALREALRTGPSAVEEFLRTYRLDSLPKSSLVAVASVGQTGWDGTNRCVYFDPIEAMDFYLNLEQKAAQDSEEEALYADL